MSDMTEFENLFNAAQFIIIECIRNLVDMQDDFKEVDPILARKNMQLIDENLVLLNRLIDKMEKEVWIELEEDEDEEYSDDEEDSSSSSSFSSPPSQ